MRTSLTGVFAIAFIFVAMKVPAQTSNERVNGAMHSIAGCYESGVESDGALRLNADGTFTWTKDTVRKGTWEWRKVSGIPFPGEIVVLKFDDARKKEKYSIDTGGNTGKRAISIRGKWEMKERPCK